jgi:two-component system, NtrC family, sensor kinase
MTSERGATLVVLCPADEPVAALERIAARNLPSLPDGFVLELGSGDIAERVRLARAARGSIALGVVTRDEPSALLALEAGADESTTLDHLDDRSALGFVDRVLLRARLRAEREEMRALYVHHEKLAALGTLVAGVAHEVNNPLTALLLTVEALRLRAGPVTPQSAPALELLEEIEVSARTIASVVRDLKVFSRPDSDDAPSELVDLTALLDQVLRIVGRQIRSLATLELDYEPDLPEVVVPAARLAQVFTNILVNAAHAVSLVVRPAHTVRICARSDADTVAISISDTGPGISDQVIERIFEPFFSTKERGAGTGLGLSISRSIVQRFGGDLLVESVHGDGATFIVLVPRPTPGEVAEARERGRSMPALVGPGVSRRRVLLVESDDRVRRAMARALDGSYDVVGVSDATEAIERLEFGPGIDAILADASAPDFSGTALCRWLSARHHELRSRLILVLAEEQELPPEAHAGVPVLFKPLGQKALLRAVQGWIG